MISGMDCPGCHQRTLVVFTSSAFGVTSRERTCRVCGTRVFTEERVVGSVVDGSGVAPNWVRNYERKAAHGN